MKYNKEMEFLLTKDNCHELANIDILEFYEKNYKWLRKLRKIPILKHLYVSILKAVDDESYTINYLVYEYIKYYIMYYLIDDHDYKYHIMYDELDKLRFEIMSSIGGNNRFYILTQRDIDWYMDNAFDYMYTLYDGPIDKNELKEKIKDKFEVNFFLSGDFDEHIYETRRVLNL